MVGRDRGTSCSVCFSALMRLLMVSGDRAAVAGKRGAFWYTLQGFAEHWESVDILCPHVPTVRETVVHGETLGLPHHVRFFPGPRGLWRQPGFIRRQGAQLHAEQPYDVMTVQEYPPFYNGIGAALLHRAIGIPYAYTWFACIVLSFLGPCSLQHFTFNCVLRTWQARHGTVLSPTMPLPWRGGADVPEVWSDLLALSNAPLPHDPTSLADSEQEAMLS